MLEFFGLSNYPPCNETEFTQTGIVEVKEGTFSRERMMSSNRNDKWVVKTVVSEEVCTDREMLGLLEKLKDFEGRESYTVGSYKE